MLLSTTIAALALAAHLGRADFIIANTTSCYGAFPLNACSTNVQVISDGTNYNTSFTCDNLHHAQNHRYIHSQAAGPQSVDFTSTSDVCGAGRLYFQRNYTTTSVNGTFDIYQGTDASGDSVGQCTYLEAKMEESKRRCSQLLGTIFYVGAYRCNTTICESDETTTTTMKTGALTSTTSTSSTSTSEPTASSTLATSSSPSTSASSLQTTSSDSATSPSSQTLLASAASSATLESSATSESATSTSQGSSISGTSTAVAKRSEHGTRWVG